MVDVTGFYYRETAYGDLSSPHSTRKVNADKVLKVDLARFRRRALQLRVQKKRLNRTAKLLGTGKTVCCISALLYVCAYIENYCYSREDKEYELHREKPLSHACLPNVTFEQMKIF